MILSALWVVGSLISSIVSFLSDKKSMEEDATDISAASSDRFDVDACGENEMADGEMREVRLAQGAPALLVREKGAYYAIGGRCTHFGAPLVKGALSDGRVRCPWHGACFRFDSGEIEEYPGLDSVPKFEVAIKDGRVRIQGRAEQLNSTRCTRPMVTLKEPCLEPPIVIVGASAAGMTAAETLRQEGYSGRLVLLSAESKAPYDRTMISKLMDGTLDRMRLRPEEFFATYDLELRLGCPAIGANLAARTVRLGDGTEQPFSKLLLASGVRPRNLNVPGEDLPGVYHLRDLCEANTLAEASQGKKVVVVGSSFIAMEAAAFFASKREAEVRLLMRGDIPFARSFGPKVGAAMMAYFETKGIRFDRRQEVERFEAGPDGRLAAAVLKSGSRVEAELALVAVGSKSNACFLPEDAPVERTREGFIRTDAFMATAADGVFAAGDLASFPLHDLPGQDAPLQLQIGHWHMAQQHGRVAGYNMAHGKSKKLKSVPFFTSMLYGKNLRFCGHIDGYDDTVLHGNLDDLNFVLFYIKAGIVVGATSCAKDPVVAQLAEMFAQGKTVRKEEIVDDPQAFAARLTKN